MTKQDLGGVLCKLHVFGQYLCDLGLFLLPFFFEKTNKTKYKINRMHIQEDDMTF